MTVKGSSVADVASAETCGGSNGLTRPAELAGEGPPGFGSRPQMSSKTGGFNWLRPSSFQTLPNLNPTRGSTHLDP